MFAVKIYVCLEKVCARLEEAGLGSCDVDRFAGAHNNRARFNSLFARGLTLSRSRGPKEGVSHNFDQIDHILDHVEPDDAEAVSSCPNGRTAPSGAASSPELGGSA